MQQGGLTAQSPALQQSLRQPTYETSLFQSPFATNSPSPGPQPSTLATPPSQYNQYTPSYGYPGRGPSVESDVPAAAAGTPSNEPHCLPVVREFWGDSDHTPWSPCSGPCHEAGVTQGPEHRMGR